MPTWYPDVGIDQNLMLLRIAVGAFGICALAASIVTIVRAFRARARGEKIVLSRWEAGTWLQGKRADPRLMLGVSVIEAAVAVWLLVRAIAPPSLPPAYRTHIPEGWLDVSRTAPASNLDALPPELAQAARETAKHVTVLAMDVADRDAEWTMPSLSVTVSEGGGEVDDQRVSRFIEEGFVQPAHKSHTELRVLSRGYVTLSGTRVATATIEMASSTTRVARTRLYFFPAPSQLMVLGVSAPAGRFDKFDGVFATIAEKTASARVTD
jgi:hypothetical protein